MEKNKRKSYSEWKKWYEENRMEREATRAMLEKVEEDVKRRRFESWYENELMSWDRKEREDWLFDRWKDWEEKVGYYGEKVVLLAQTLGLNTCWVGLTYKKIPGAFQLREGDIVHCEISLGYGANQGVQHPLKPIEKFYEADGEVPAWFKAGMEAALLAPTAINQQKFKFFLRDGNKVEARPLRSMAGYTVIDLGIVKCHFEIGAGMENFIWE